MVYGKGAERAEEILSFMKRTGSYQNSVTADLYPYTASYTGIGILFPSWAKQPKRYAGIREGRGDELAEFLRNRVNLRNGPEATLFGSAPYKGKTLADVASEYGLPFEIVLRDIIGPYGASAAYFIMDEALQKRLVQDEQIMIGSDGSPTMYHPRGYGSFAKVIEEYAVQDSLMTLEEAIRKMTSLPAETIGLPDRGILTEGAKADILLFDPQKVRALASFDDPHQLASGFDLVIVNGKIAIDQSGTASRAGKLLLKSR